MLCSKPVVACWAELDPRAEGVRPGARVLLFRTVQASAARLREPERGPGATARPGAVPVEGGRGSDGHLGAERDGDDAPPRRPGRAEAPSAETEADEGMSSHPLVREPPHRWPPVPMGYQPCTTGHTSAEEPRTPELPRRAIAGSRFTPARRRRGPPPTAAWQMGSVQARPHASVVQRRPGAAPDHLLGCGY